MSELIGYYLAFLAMGFPLVVGALFVGVWVGMAIQRAMR